MIAENRWIARLGWCLALFALVTVPAVADDVVLNGADLWQTASAGSTFTSFGDDPLPAGFFCAGSPAYDGKINLRGEPLVTKPAGVLGGADTIVQRLDDTTFDIDGNASTRIQLLALSLVGEETIDVGCDQAFDVSVSLAGEQPMTEMTITRLNEAGGTYVAPLALDVRMTFSPAGEGDLASVEITRHVDLLPGTHSYWRDTDLVGTDKEGNPVQVDTDGDGVADTAMPNESNFRTGIALTGIAGPGACQPGYCPYESCHCNPDSDDPFEEGVCDDDHEHCTWTCVPAELLPGPVSCVSIEL